MGCDNSPYPRAKARIGNSDQQDGQSKMLKKILEPLKYFAVAAIVTALILLGFQLGKENNSELVQHLQAEKIRLESELSSARDENTRLLLEQTRASVVKPEPPLAENNAQETVQPPAAEPVEIPAETASPVEPALGQISETFSAGDAAESSEQESAQE